MFLKYSSRFFIRMLIFSSLCSPLLFLPAFSEELTLNTKASQINFDLQTPFFKTRGKFDKFFGKITLNENATPSATSLSLDLKSLRLEDQTPELSILVAQLLNTSNSSLLTFASSDFRKRSLNSTISKEYFINGTAKLGANAEQVRNFPLECLYSSKILTCTGSYSGKNNPQNPLNGTANFKLIFQ